MSEQNKASSFEDALSALTDALSLREKDLDEREQELKKSKEHFEIDRSAGYGDTSPSDVLNLNVGGNRTTVLRRTLTSVPESMLASRFSGRWDDSIEKDKNDDFFIDQEFSLFEIMLNYLRNKANVIDKYPLQSPTITRERVEDFYRMLDYYGMTNGLYPTNLAIHTGSEDSVEIIGSKEVNAKEWTTFHLVSAGHERRVKSYEVRLGADVKRIQIGWKITKDEVKFVEGNTVGVGDVSHTFALDLTLSTYLVEGVRGSNRSSGAPKRNYNSFRRSW
mmetsp:Transcript_1454/g.1994  ORF Transcript_1454/g.1994 Transcript_1454/m.1994 type:complete len:277 (-) Transcript_1454:267-1097(-)